MEALKPGTKVRTLYHWSSTGTVMRPRKINLPAPGPDWYVVKFDDGNRGQLYVHREMLAVRND